jgi:hypothetical protein
MRERRSQEEMVVSEIDRRSAGDRRSSRPFSGRRRCRLCGDPPIGPRVELCKGCKETVWLDSKLTSEERLVKRDKLQLALVRLAEAEGTG